ncbi:Aste57867_3043 [Aphanomyces stellatus]|uniref:Aste57867_3043 protein n=1 Tax=Aphanomyces stellatus TaxID=120398 RepID=A0A485K9X2_9STRA|nr:hypothetical protein As57867_003034 [Aphanomyces stellatus]VFT80223.1 Aste57867_3043 [Aphanomyces stellatus]
MVVRELSDTEREAILREVLLKSNGSYTARLPNGFGAYLAEKYNRDVTTIRSGNMKVSVASQKKGRVVWKKLYPPDQVKAKFLQIPLAERTTLRSVAEKSGIMLPTLHRYMQHGMFRAHSNATKPLLTDANKCARFQFAAAKVRMDGEMHDMTDEVHVDEKWFYMTKVYGDNSYKVPHLSKEKLMRKGLLPVNVVCPEDVYGAAKASLDAIDVAAMEESIEEELRESRAVNELAQELESMICSTTWWMLLML